MMRRRGAPSPTWRSFLLNQAQGIAAIDMFVVAAASFRLLYVMIILAHDRRKIVRFDVTLHPTAGWLSRQVPRRSRGTPLRAICCAIAMPRMAGTSAAGSRRWRSRKPSRRSRSPWQNAYVERMIGSIRRECLDHVVIFNERHLRRVLLSYVEYYHRTRTHLALDKDCPDSRPVIPPRIGRVVAMPKVGGLHHRYERLAA
jgi:putative transposase